MNTDVFVNDDFKVTLNADRFENYLSFSAAISFETALDAAALKNDEFYKEIGKSLITELYNKHELWMTKGAI